MGVWTRGGGFCIFDAETMPETKRFLETATEEDVELVRRMIREEGEKGRTYISRRVCEAWGWRTPKGKLRDMQCREVLRELERKGLIELPPRRKSCPQKGYKNRTSLGGEEGTLDLFGRDLDCSLRGLGDLSIEMVRGTRREKRYNGLIGAYHYLGYNQQAGEQLKYLVYGGNSEVACVGFGASALKLRCRDEYIGWSEEKRMENLQKVVNNNRFLILPHVRVKHLASHILGTVLRRLREDWYSYYGREIVLVETFVDKERFKGTCYRASNWQLIGTTAGRGRNDRSKAYALSVKDVYVYPLVKNYRSLLGARAIKA